MSDEQVPQAAVQPVTRSPEAAMPRARVEPPLEPTLTPEARTEPLAGSPTRIGPETSDRMRRLGPVLAALAALVALAVRLRDPLSSSVIAAEDPYIAMQRAWDILQGVNTQGAPGPSILLVPFALLGPDMLYQATRFLPAVLGAAAVIVTYLLARKYVTEAGAVASGILVAMIPDFAFRTAIMVPIVLDFVLLPLLLLAVMKAVEGSRRATITAFAIALVQGVIHPWALALALPPVGVFLLVETRRARHRRAITSPAVVGAGKVWGAGVLALAAFSPLLAFALAPDVHLFGMLSMPAIILAAAGGVVAVKKRSKFGTLALLWTLLILPVALVDWFGIWYLPHRAVAYVGIGVALLAAVGVSWLVEFVTAGRDRVRAPVALVTLGILALVLAPSAMAEPWYRIYDEQDFEAYNQLAAEDEDHVQAASWQAATGYRAITGKPAMFNPDFFEKDAFRNFELSQNPDTVVLVDEHAAEEGIPTDFLQDGDWELIVDEGDVQAYRHVG